MPPAPLSHLILLLGWHALCVSTPLQKDTLLRVAAAHATHELFTYTLTDSVNDVCPLFNTR